MSSEGSSDKANSGNDFEGNSLSSMTPRVGELLTSHGWTPQGGSQFLVRTTFDVTPRAQAQVQNPFICVNNFHKGPFDWSFGHLWTCFKANTMRD